MLPGMADTQCVNVRDLGAAANPDADDTDLINGALKEHACVTVPPGVYRIDGTLEVRSSLTLLPGARLLRPRPASSAPAHDPTAPVVILCGREAALLGGGSVESQNSSPRGVICVGPLTLSTETVVFWSRIDGVKIVGAGGDGVSVGLNLDSSEPAPPQGAGKGSTYCGNFTNLRIQGVDAGIKVGRICNGHTFSNVFFSGIKQYSYWSLDNSENTFVGGFTHLSHGATIIKLERVAHNLFYAIQGEPGQDQDAQGNPINNPSRFFDVDTASIYCQILGFGNCSASPLYTAPMATTDDPVAPLRALTCLHGGMLSAVSFQAISHDRKLFGDPYRMVPQAGAPQADSGATTIDQLRADFNALLGKLRASGAV
jgi:hypothetical protein